MMMFRLLKDFHNEESGQGFVEYLLMLLSSGWPLLWDCQKLQIT